MKKFVIPLVILVLSVTTIAAGTYGSTYYGNKDNCVKSKSCSINFANSLKEKIEKERQEQE